jgi:ribosomal protein S2
MTKYVYCKKKNGVYMLDVVKIYEKIQAAARIIAAIPDPSLVIVSLKSLIKGHFWKTIWTKSHL